ncbi:MAG TPA: hypothetical protein VF594_00945, partial [Rubricoccaceae bacterium]
LSPLPMRAFLQSALALTLAIGGCSASRPDGAASEPAASAPAETAEPEVAPTGEVRIALGESADVDSVPVRFVSVVEDSRCPPDVTCVWAGRARVQLSIGGETVVLAVPSVPEDPEMPTEATVAGLTVRVSALAGPAPSQPGSTLPVWVELVAGRAGR